MRSNSLFQINCDLPTYRIRILQMGIRKCWTVARRNKYRVINEQNTTHIQHVNIQRNQTIILPKVAYISSNVMCVSLYWSMKLHSEVVVLHPADRYFSLRFCVLMHAGWVRGGMHIFKVLPYTWDYFGWILTDLAQIWSVIKWKMYWTFVVVNLSIPTDRMRTHSLNVVTWSVDVEFRW